MPSVSPIHSEIARIKNDFLLKLNELKQKRARIVEDAYAQQKKIKLRILQEKIKTL